MIKTIRHKGLKRLFEEDDPSGVNPEHARKLLNILATLHAAPSVDHMDLPGFRLHPLSYFPAQNSPFGDTTARSRSRLGHKSHAVNGTFPSHDR